MSLFTVFDIASSALSAQSQRLNVVASNLANAESATTANGTPYKARQVVFTAMPVAPGETSLGVNVTGVVEDPAPPRLVYDPTHPMAERTATPCPMNVVEEMTNMIRPALLPDQPGPYQHFTDALPRTLALGAQRTRREALDLAPRASCLEPLRRR
jgi:flagellar basal-body rod protein FlgC